ncbi:unnamed protein product [Dovyalis caffra]|uniref:Uncharacterized protein n=1 Tax=Dovyalis caffra TaxID=77055 RepID=A0AAV1SXY4_9ROSI|nr:unnamed protein product [Dovyalis caffra]
MGNFGGAIRALFYGDSITSLSTVNGQNVLENPNAHHEAPQIDARQLKEENEKPIEVDKTNAEVGLGEKKFLPPLPNIPIPGIPFPQFPFPPPFDIPNVPPLPDFPLPPFPFPFPPNPFFQSPPA